MRCLLRELSVLCGENLTSPSERHETTWCSNRHGLRNSPRHQCAPALGEPQRRQVRRRFHHDLRRQQLPHAHKCRGERLVPRRCWRRSETMGKARPPHQVRHRRRTPGSERFRRPRHCRPRPFRRLPRRRRRSAGLLQLQPHDGRRPQKWRTRPRCVYSRRSQAARSTT